MSHPLRHNGSIKETGEFGISVAIKLDPLKHYSSITSNLNPYMKEILKLPLKFISLIFRYEGYR